MATENYLLSIQGNVNGEYNECVQCFESSGTDPTNTFQTGVDLLTAWDTNARSLWLACLPSSYSLGLLSAKRAFPKPTANPMLQYGYGSHLGTRGSDATSYNLCPVMFLVPPMGIKSGGKTFMPCVAQGDIVNNSYVSGYQTAVDAYFAALLAGLAGSGTNWKLAIYSRKAGSASLVQSFGLSERIGYQGRRRKPVGA